MLDYELKLWSGWGGIMYIEPEVGEVVVGKIYQLTKEQIESTDIYEGNSYKRIKIKSPDNKEEIWTYAKA